MSAMLAPMPRVMWHRHAIHASCPHARLMSDARLMPAMLPRPPHVPCTGGGRVRLAVIDQIISLAPVHLPVAPLCALCRRYGAASLVDGAHAVGAVPLDLPSLKADYYTSNLHK